SYVIIYDSDYNPQNDIQALYRTYRIGQERTVRIYRLFCRSCVDQRIVERARRKMLLSHLLLETPNTESGLSSTELNSLLKEGASDLMSTNGESGMAGGTLICDTDLDHKAESQITYNDADIDALLTAPPDKIHLKGVEVDEDTKAQSGARAFFETFHVADFRISEQDMVSRGVVAEEAPDHTQLYSGAGADSVALDRMLMGTACMESSKAPSAVAEMGDTTAENDEDAAGQDAEFWAGLLGDESEEEDLMVDGKRVRKCRLKKIERAGFETSSEEEESESEEDSVVSIEGPGSDYEYENDISISELEEVEVDEEKK
ncbi:hypothetical protein KIPB_009505, partial [Kipferlia bialata]